MVALQSGASRGHEVKRLSLFRSRSLKTSAAVPASMPQDAERLSLKKRQMRGSQIRRQLNDAEDSGEERGDEETRRDLEHNVWALAVSGDSSATEAPERERRRSRLQGGDGYIPPSFEPDRGNKSVRCVLRGRHSERHIDM